MKAGQQSYLRLAPLLLPALTFSHSAVAGSWVQPKGQLEYTQSYSYYNSNHYRDVRGVRRSTSAYRKHELNPYFEYGLSENTTLGANLFLPYVNKAGKAHYGIGDSEFFARRKLWKAHGYVLSFAPLVKLPTLPRNNSQPPIGSSHIDVAGITSLGYGFSAFGRNHYLNFDVEYRERFSKPNNQWRFTASAGIQLSERWMVIPQLYVTSTPTKAISPTFTQTSNDDYDLTKLQLNLEYKLDEKRALTFGAFHHHDGKNTGLDNGLMVSVRTRF
jgi:protein XagA